MTLGEIWQGIAYLKPGRRRTALEQSFTTWLELMPPEHVLPFGAEEARIFGDVRAHRKAIGRPISYPDAIIAATCIAHDATLFTRNTSDFDELNLRLVNPWED
ncbi:PIN domain-containing protein [Corynebacterium aquatimens]|uniref:PIN domain-containing protein n=2 Tax=Corynebacterium TaxID=1716 RepID=UPI00253F816C|nr:PIN domain-containing protein [Corynebacterium aquatimens]QYH19798.1 PIN domain-containing protein [Corynebacterium aquatimens]